MHLTVISSIKTFLLPAMPTSAQDYTTSYAASTRANVEAAACVMLWRTMLTSVASTGLSLTSDLIFLTVVSNVCRTEYLLEMCKILQISFAPQNTGIDLFCWKLELCHGLMTYSEENATGFTLGAWVGDPELPHRACLSHSVCYRENLNFWLWAPKSYGSPY